MEEKTIVYINSYHTGLAWSDGILSGIKSELINSNVRLHVFEMDTKRQQSEHHKQEAALRAKAFIEKNNPDVVIISDDNAAKYLIVPYFLNGTLPVVFCGINWDASEYRFPAKNVTGMIEVQLIPELIERLLPYATGKRIGYLKGESLSSRKEVEYFEKALGVNIDKRFAQNIHQWKSEYIDLQDSVDILLMGNGSAIPGWDEEDFRSFVLENTRIPSAGWDISTKELVLLTFGNKAEEQGSWAAKKALEIVKGKAVESISLAKNKKAIVFINTLLAKKLDIIFPFELIDQASLVP